MNMLVAPLMDDTIINSIALVHHVEPYVSTMVAQSTNWSTHSPTMVSQPLLPIEGLEAMEESTTYLPINHIWSTISHS